MGTARARVNGSTPWYSRAPTMSKYELLSELGRGGMGVVHRARQADLDREVALKVLLPTAGGAAEAARFVREIETLTKLAHPHIVRVLDSGQLDGRWYYAMELITGQSLDRVITDTGAMPAPRAVKLMRQAASALAACHQAGFVHRDLKPGNLMVSEGDHLTLMDFGLVKVEDRTVLTATGQMVGTPHYIAPEVLRGEKMSPATDVYALGVVLMQLLAGRAPFRSDSMAALLAEITREGPTPLAELRPDVPAPLAELAGRMVAREAATRPPAAEVARALESLATGGGARRPGARSGPLVRSRVTAVPSQPPASTATPGHGARVALAAAGVAAALAAAVWLARHPGAPPAPPSVAASEPAPRPALALHLDPPRGAHVAGDWPPGTSWRLTSGDALVSSGTAPPLTLAGLEPARSYRLEVRPAGATPLTTSFAMPRIAPADVHLVPSESSLAITLHQFADEPFEVTVQRDGKRVWSGHTSDHATFWPVYGLAASTDYQVIIRPERAGAVRLPEVEYIRTTPAGVRHAAREKLQRLSDLAVMNAADELGDDLLPSDVELVPAMVERLKIAIAKHDADVVKACVLPLARIHDPRALPALIEAARLDWDAGTMKRVVRAIGAQYRAAGFDAIVGAAARLDPGAPDQVTGYCMALGNSDLERAQAHFRAVAHQPDAFPRFDRLSLPVFMEQLGFTGCAPDAIASAFAHPQDDDLNRLAGHLAFLGGAEAHRAIRTLMERWVAASPRPPGLDIGVLALGRTGGPEDSPLIERALALGGGPEERRAAVIALGFTGGPVAEKRAVALLADPDPAVRRSAAMALGRLRAASGVEPLLAKLDMDAGFGRVPRALGMIGDARATAPLLALCGRPPPAAGTYTSAEVDRAEALWALGQMADPRVREPAARALASPVDYVRLRAGEALGLLGPAAAPSLAALDAALARPGETPVVKAALRRAIAHVKGQPRPSGRLIIMDAAEPFETTRVEALSGEVIRVSYAAAWSAGTDHLLTDAKGERFGEGQLERIHLRCAERFEELISQETKVFSNFRGGVVSFEIEGFRRDGFGFAELRLE